MTNNIYKNMSVKMKNHKYLKRTFKSIRDINHNNITKYLIYTYQKKTFTYKHIFLKLRYNKNLENIYNKPITKYTIEYNL